MKLHVSTGHGKPLLLPAILGLLLPFNPFGVFSFVNHSAGLQARAAAPPVDTKQADSKQEDSKQAAAPQSNAATPSSDDSAATPPADPGKTEPPELTETNSAAGEAIPGEVEKSRDKRFAEYMTGATLSGQFTIVGKPNGEMPKEEYTIIKCEKLPEGDLYRFTARIRYGETDAELPMDLPVYWAGDTPVISLTNLWIPGLGTFSSRVMIYQDHYAGTWTHGEVGGHLFGVIKKEE